MSIPSRIQNLERIVAARARRRRESECCPYHDWVYINSVIDNPNDPSKHLPMPSVPTDEEVSSEEIEGFLDEVLGKDRRSSKEQQP